MTLIRMEGVLLLLLLLSVGHSSDDDDDCTRDSSMNSLQYLNVVFHIHTQKGKKRVGER